MQTANSQESAAEEFLAPECITQLFWSGQARRKHTGPYILLENIQVFTPGG